VTPDSLLALHDAGYGAVRARLGPGRVLDVGCGEGFESARLGGAGRAVVGVDYACGALARARPTTDVVHFVGADATALALGDATFDWACSSHLVEHFSDPGPHLSELARVLRPEGTAFVLTPNAPADFENPFHLRLFRKEQLAEALGAFFAQVWVGGLDASARVKEDFARRRAKATRLLRLDVFGLRHRVPRSWYVAAYSRVLPLAYRHLARGETGGASGITAADFFVADVVDDSTPVLFATAKEPRSHPRRRGRTGAG
jgi:SAM-dependent methyltransferase